MKASIKAKLEHQHEGQLTHQFEKSAMAICAELASQVKDLAIEAGVDDIISAFTSKPLLLPPEDQNSQQRLIYIDVYAAMRDFTPAEQEQGEKYDRSSDAAEELRKLIAEAVGLLGLAADAGLAEYFIKTNPPVASFMDDICFRGQDKPCGLFIASLSMVPLQREDSGALQAANLEGCTDSKVSSLHESHAADSEFNQQPRSAAGDSDSKAEGIIPLSPAV